MKNWALFLLLLTWTAGWRNWEVSGNTIRSPEMSGPDGTANISLLADS